MRTAGALMLAMWLLSDPASAAEVAIIVNKSNDLKALKVGELEWIFRGKKVRWPDGQKVVVINRPVRSKQREVFYKRVFNADPTLKFFKPGSPVPFTTLVMNSDKAALRFVSRIPNAISYVSADAVDDTVRVLAVENW